MLELLVTASALGGVAVFARLVRRRPPGLAEPTYLHLRATEPPDLPCPWCRAATAETDVRCPSCGRAFGSPDRPTSSRPGERTARRSRPTRAPSDRIG